MRADSVAALDEVIRGSWLRGRSSIGQNQTELEGGKTLRKGASDRACSEKVERGLASGREVTAAG